MDRPSYSDPVCQSPSHLLHRCAAAEAEAWSELIERYGPPLRRAVRRALADAGERPASDEVEERVQDLYCRLLEADGRRLRGFRGHSEGEAIRYLVRVARNVVLDDVRERRAAKRGAGASGAVAPDEDLPDFAPNPEDRYLARERRKLFLVRCRRALAGTAVERNLRILRLAVLEGWTSREISGRLGGAMSAGAVDSVLHRARRRLLADGVAVPGR